MSTTKAGDIVGQTLQLADNFVNQRKYDRDKAKVPVWRTRFSNPTIHLILETTPEKVATTDLTVDTFEVDEMPFKLVVQKITGAGNEHTFYVPNAYADLIPPRMELRNDHINAAVDDDAQTVTYTVATDATLKSQVLTPDAAIVSQVGTKSADLVGYAKVTVERLHQIKSYTAVGYAATAYWDTETDGHHIVRTGKTNHESGSAGQAVSKNLEGVTNWLERTEHDFELSNYEVAVEKYGEADPYGRVKQQSMEDFMRQLEHKWLFGTIGGERQVSGNKTETYMRGLIKMITADMNRTITNYSIKTVNYAMRPILDVGTSVDRIGIAGSGFMMKLASIAEAHLTQSPLAGNFGMGHALQFFQSNFNKRVHFGISREMTESPRFIDSCFILNSQYLRYGFLKGHDIQLWKGASGAGLQDNGAPKGHVKHQLMCVNGPLHAFPGSQGLVTFTC